MSQFHLGSTGKSFVIFCVRLGYDFVTIETCELRQSDMGPGQKTISYRFIWTCVFLHQQPLNIYGTQIDLNQT